MNVRKAPIHQEFEEVKDVKGFGADSLKCLKQGKRLLLLTERERSDNFYKFYNFLMNGSFADIHKNQSVSCIK